MLLLPYVVQRVQVFNRGNTAFVRQTTPHFGGT